MKDTFANRLKYAMQNKNISQAELVRETEKYEYKIGSDLLNKYLKGNALARQNRLTVLANILEVSESWLMGYDVPINSTKTEKKYIIPILGTVAAGELMMAEENIIGYVEIDERLAKKGDFFALKVKGNSMLPYMIEGDTVIVRKQNDVEDGEIGIILIDSCEATIKLVYKNANGITLKAFNEKVWQPKSYSAEEIKNLPVQVIGRFAQLQRDEEQMQKILKELLIEKGG